MGKGDQKTRRGKIIRGSYGAHRRRKKISTPKAVVEPPVVETKAVKKPAEEVRKTRKVDPKAAKEPAKEPASTPKKEPAKSTTEKPKAVKKKAVKKAPKEKEPKAEEK